MPPKRKSGYEMLYWTVEMDDVLLDAFIHQQNMGNRVGGTFTTHAYDNILNELKEKFSDKPLDKDKIKNRIKQIKKNFVPCYDLFKNGMSGFAWNPVSKMWSAEPEVWQKLIEAKPEAAEWMSKPIHNYEKLTELYGQDRATGEQAETAAEIRQKRYSSGGENYWESIDGIDHLVSQEEATIHPFTFDDDVEIQESPSVRSDGPSKSATSSKRQKSKRLNEDFQLLKDGMHEVSQAIRDAAAEVVKPVNRLPITESEVWSLVKEVGVEGRVLTDCYIHLTRNSVDLQSFLGCPSEHRKETMLSLVYGNSSPPSQ